MAFVCVAACISSKCHGLKSCVSTPTSIDSDSGSSGKLPCGCPRSTPMMQPDARRVMAKNNSLLASMNLRQRTPRSKSTLEFARHLVVIAFNEMDSFAVQTLAIGCNLFNAAHAEIAEKIQRVVWLDALVQSIRDARIHLFRACKRSITVANDIEVPEVKVGCEPSISHIFIMK